MEQDLAKNISFRKDSTLLVGHYSAAFLAKKTAPQLPLWVFFIAVQLLDYVHFFLKILGVEHSTVDPHQVGPLSMDLYFMPFSHSLLAAVIISGLVGFAGLKFYSKKAAVCLAAAVLSHWVLDFLVHSADLPIALDGGLKVGLGMWNLPLTSFLFEIILFLGAAVYFCRALMSGAFLWLMALMTACQIAFSLLLTPPTDPTLMSLAALATYSIFSYLIFLTIDRRHS